MLNMCFKITRQDLISSWVHFLKIKSVKDLNNILSTNHSMTLDSIVLKSLPILKKSIMFTMKIYVLYQKGNMFSNAYPFVRSQN